MANPIARMSEFRRQKIGKKICRQADPRVAIDLRPDTRLVRLHAGHTPVDLMAYIIGLLFTSKGEERC